MRTVSLFLAFILSMMTVNSSYARTAMISTLDVAEGLTRDQERGKVEAFLKSETIRKEMLKMGVSPDEALKRVAALSPKEIHYLSQEIDKAPAGGDAVGSVLGLAFVVFIVLLVTDILGFTKVFPFTRPVR